MLGVKRFPIVVAGMACLLAARADAQSLAAPAAGRQAEQAPGTSLFRPSSEEPLLFELPAESPAARFARHVDEGPLYAVSSPQWTHRQLNWIEPHQLVSATAFEDLPHEALAPPSPRPASLWERWRQQRLERRRSPASWFRYPFYFEKFTSVVRSDEPIHNQIHNGLGNLFGARLGWDLAPRWGLESRLGYMRSTMKDKANPLLPPHENFLFWDATALYYLTGDTRLRPFLALGLGVVDVGFIDDVGVRWSQTLLTMPYGAGIKFRIDNHNALRLEVVDNLVFGNGHGGNSQPMHDLAVSFAFERRFGKPHKTYFPSRDDSHWSRCRQWWASMSN